LVNGETDDAVKRLQRITRERNPLDPRLDLEHDRAMARLILASGYLAQGQKSAARPIVEALRRQWSGADPGFTGTGAAAELDARL